MMSLPLLIILYSLSLLGQSEAVQCFRCSVTAEPKHNKTMLCTKFDESDAFIVNCPHSTMCVKTVLRSQLAGNQVETVIRDCAQQKFVEQVFRNGQWEKEITIEEPYEEKCEMAEDIGREGNSKMYCHCRGNLCNSATKDQNLLTSYHIDAMGVIFVFNAMKYFRTLD